MKLIAFICLMPVALAQMSSAQLCVPETKPSIEDAFSYVRAEIKALQWVKYAIVESQKIQIPAANDPQRFHKTVEMYAIGNTVSDDYTCAASMIARYRQSKQEMIRSSSEALFEAITTSNDINKKLIATVKKVNNARNEQELKPEELAEFLGNAKSLQKDIRNMTVMAVKGSTYSILRGEGGDDNWKPVAFTIKASERAALLREANELAKQKNEKQVDYVDVCADFLVETLDRQLPTTN